MREPSQTADDLAVAAAKQQLGSLAARAGYREAMRPARRASRTGQIVCSVLALGFGGLAYASCTQLETTWLRGVIGLVFGALAGFGALAALGMAPGRPPQRWGVAVIGKRIARDGDDDRRLVTLLREDGSSHELGVVDTIHDTLRAGDCGVAEVTCLADGAPVLVAAFYRL